MKVDIEMLDTTGVEGGGTTNDTMDIITLRKEEFGEVRTVWKEKHKTKMHESPMAAGWSNVSAPSTMVQHAMDKLSVAHLCVCVPLCLYE